MIFQDVFIKKPGRSLFNLTHERKFSCDWSGLYPFLFMEAVPGDTFRISTEMVVRTAPLVSPVMHRVNVKMYYFFVPNRLLFSKWEDFITGVDQKKAYVDAENSNDYFVNPVLPYFDVTSTNINSSFLKDGSLADFLTFPTCRQNQDISGTVRVPMMPFAAYQKVYDDWFRNQNVEAPHLTEALPEGAISQSLAYEMLTMRRKMWEKDYFTSSLPFAQRGDAVDIPFSVSGLRLSNDNSKPTYIRNTDSETDLTTSSNIVGVATQGSNAYKAVGGSVLSDSVDGHQVFDSSEFLNVDVSSHTSVVGDGASGTINDLRIATRLQRWLEKNARVGGRYIEQILAHFAVKSSDARLQRAEYLGGFTNPIIIEPVEQNSASQWNTEDSSTTSETFATPQGTLVGKGTSYGQNKPIKCYCEEHGFILGIMTILPRTAYQDQLSRMWQRSNRYDYYFPEFAHLGEQEVNKAEVYFNIANEQQRSTDRFGFQERYCEYKYQPSTIHGDFKGSLHFWHLGRTFGVQPALNKSFVEANPNTDIFAVSTGGNHFYVNLINNVQALRPMPKQAIPTL